MLFVIIIFGVLATFGFRAKLIEKGYEDSRAWAYPLLTSSMIFCFAWFINYASRFWIKSPSLSHMYSLVVEVLAVLVFGLLVSRLWKRIKVLPDVKAADE